MAAIAGTNVIAPVVPFDTNDTYPSHDAIYGKGGLTHAATLVARDGIPALRRRAGMLCYVDATQKMYRLDSDLTTWVEFTTSGAGGGTTYLASFGDASPASVFEVPAGEALNEISITVVETWAAAGANVKLGVVGDVAKYFDSDETILTEAGASFSKDFSELGPITIVLTITPGTTPTPTGKVRIQISTTKAGT